MRAQVNLIPNPTGKQLAFATLFVPIPGGEIAVDGFTVVAGAKGNFVGFPQGAPYDKDGTKVYPKRAWIVEPLEDGVRFGPVQRQVEQTVLTAYAVAAGGKPDDRVAAAAAHEDPAAPTGARPASKARAAAAW